MVTKKGFLFADWWPEWATIRHPLAWMVAILLVAAVLRIYGLYNLSPPGLEHDEVANWLIDRSILNGRLAIYFTEAYGHEAGFHYLQAAFVALLGDHALALRLPATFVGLLVIAVQYALTRRLFGVTTALLSAALLAILFWPVFYSRLGLRAITFPLVAGLSLYAWWKAWPIGQNRVSQSLQWFALSGLLAGLSLHTYMAARAVPIFYAVFLLYLLLLHRADFKQQWRGIILFWVMLTLVALPLVIYLATNPGSEFRISEIDAPLRALTAGDPRPVLQNLLRIAGMFGFSGDPLWRQNVAYRPVFDPLLGLFFYGGVVLALLRFKDARYAYLLLWLGASSLPSMVTADAPSSIRMIGALLVVTVFPVLVINMIARLSTLSPRLSTNLAYLLGLLFLVGHIWWTARDIFHKWPQNDEVQFVWQAALTHTADFLDHAQDNSPVAIGGWSPATMDPTTMYLSMRRHDLEMRYFGSDSTAVPVTTIIVPSGNQEAFAQNNSGVRLTHPAIRSLSPGLEAQLAQWGAVAREMGTFVLYELERMPEIHSPFAGEVRFDDELQLIAAELPADMTSCTVEECRVVSTWRVLSPTGEQRRFFLHVLDNKGQLVAQHDGLDAPAQFWQAGDLLVQEHLLPRLPQGDVELRVGVYDPQNGRRLLLADGRDHFVLLEP